MVEIIAYTLVAMVWIVQAIALTLGATMNLETLYNRLADASDSETARYSNARERKVQEVAEYIADFLSDPRDAPGLANEIMDRAEEMGRIEGDTIGGEIPARYTATGNPFPFTL